MRKPRVAPNKTPNNRSVMLSPDLLTNIRITIFKKTPMIKTARNNPIKVITYRTEYDVTQVFKYTCTKLTNLNGTTTADTQTIKETASRKNPRKKLMIIEKRIITIIVKSTQLKYDIFSDDTI